MTTKTELLRVVGEFATDAVAARKRSENLNADGWYIAAGIAEGKAMATEEIIARLEALATDSGDSRLSEGEQAFLTELGVTLNTPGPTIAITKTMACVLYNALRRAGNAAEYAHEAGWQAGYEQGRHEALRSAAIEAGGVSEDWNLAIEAAAKEIEQRHWSAFNDPMEDARAIRRLKK